MHTSRKSNTTVARKILQVIPNPGKELILFAVHEEKRIQMDPVVFWGLVELVGPVSGLKTNEIHPLTHTSVEGWTPAPDFDNYLGSGIFETAAEVVEFLMEDEDLVETGISRYEVTDPEKAQKGINEH